MIIIIVPTSPGCFEIRLNEFISISHLEEECQHVVNLQSLFLYPTPHPQQVPPHLTSLHGLQQPLFPAPNLEQRGRLLPWVMVSLQIHLFFYVE